MNQSEYKKAKELKVIVRFETDESIECMRRVEQVKAIICQLIVLSRKRGRPRKAEEDLDVAA